MKVVKEFMTCNQCGKRSNSCHVPGTLRAARAPFTSFQICNLAQTEDQSWGTAKVYKYRSHDLVHVQQYEGKTTGHWQEHGDRNKV